MKRKIATKDLVLTALFAALTAVLAQIQLPIGPVPFNLAVFGAFLAGMLLEPAWAAASMGVYMLLGAVGIPVFAGFMGGPAVLLGKTGGYVIGYIFIALATALAVKRSGKLPVIGAAMLAGLLVCYGSSPGRILFRRWAGACCRSLCRTCARACLRVFWAACWRAVWQKRA